jgi:hypothetical protein
VPGRVTRKANSRPPTRAGTRVTFTADEFARLKRNTPASGILGGYQRHEHWLFDNTDPHTLVCIFDAEHLDRTIRYIRSYGSGGPNKRIRDACIPAFRRAGIEIHLGERAHASGSTRTDQAEPVSGLRAAPDRPGAG